VKFEDFVLGKTRFRWLDDLEEYLCHAIGDKVVVGLEMDGDPEEVIVVSFNEDDFGNCEEVSSSDKSGDGLAKMTYARRDELVCAEIRDRELAEAVLDLLGDSRVQNIRSRAEEIVE